MLLLIAIEQDFLEIVDTQFVWVNGLGDGAPSLYLGCFLTADVSPIKSQNPWKPMGRFTPVTTPA